MEEKLAQEAPRSSIDWPATAAGAGAAVTVAVLLSTLGAAGTLIGAALGSVVATVATALYKQGIETSRRRMAAVQALALQKVTLAEQDVRRARRSADPAASGHLARAGERLDAASSALEPGAEEAPPVPEPEPRRWADLPWKRLALVAAVVFVLALAVISLIEVLAGKSVSTITGGTDDSDRTSITGIFGDRADTGHDKPTRPAETGTTEPTGEPSESASTDPSEEPSSPTTESTVPSESGTPTATVTVTETATQPTDGAVGSASATP